MSPFGLFASPRDKIRKRVRALYGDLTDTVMLELDRYSGSVVADRDRVHRAILKVSQGSFENLRRWVNMALDDYRSVLGPAEYPNASTAEEVRRFNTWKADDETVRETTFADVLTPDAEGPD